MKNKTNVRKITDGSIIVAIYLLFLICSKMIGGLFEQWLFFLIPLPLCFYGYKYSFKENIFVATTIFIVSFIIIDPFTTLMYVLPCLLIGSTYPPILKRKLKYIIEIALITFFFLISEILTSTIFGYIFNYDIIEDTKLLVNSIVSLFNIASSEFIEAILISVIPSTLLLTSILQGILLSIILRIMLIRLHNIKSSFKFQLSFESMPKIIGVIYLFLLPLIANSIIKIPNKDSLFLIYSTILNIGTIYTFFIIYQGMYLISKYTFYAKKHYLFFISIALLFICPLIILIIGILQSTLTLSNKII